MVDTRLAGLPLHTEVDLVHIEWGGELGLEAFVDGAVAPGGGGVHDPGTQQVHTGGYKVL